MSQSASPPPRPRKPVDPRLLKVGYLVEVLDVAQLWFPANVLAVSATGVRVHFVGWDREWRDFVPVAQYATHLCQSRGWGELESDFRVGEMIEALDLMGHWLPCRVLAVAEAQVKVHYLGWTSKWDEWIHRSSGRLQQVEVDKTTSLPAVPENAGSHGKAKAKHRRGQAPHDISLNEEVCSVCHTVGELLVCEGLCFRSFHAECLAPLLLEVGAAPLAAPAEHAEPPAEGPLATREDGPAQPPANGAGAASDAAWICPDCTCRAQRCCLCGEPPSVCSPLEPPRRCTAGACGRAFHLSCLSSVWAELGPTCEAGTRARDRGECPAHVCWECGEAENAKYGQGMAVCFGCGTGVHRSCLGPESLLFTLSTLGHGLCCDCEKDHGLHARKRAMRSVQPAGGGGGGGGGGRRGLVPFRFAPLLSAPDNESLDGDEGRGSRDSGHVRNLALREIARRSSEVGHPWRPVRRGPLGPQSFELPAELVAELRSGKCDEAAGFRPEAYLHISKSVWRASRAEKSEHEQAEQEPCVCAEVELMCEDGCINRSMRHECSASTCTLGEELCCNRRIQLGHYPPLSVFKTHGKGWGVRADQSMSAGSIVVQYVGEVIDLREWELRNAQASQHEAMYFMHLSAKLVIDASRKGNISRFINHSCDPNLQVQKWFVNSQPRLAMFALRHICAGEELAYNYNVHWTGQWQSGQRCHCGARNCTGGLSASNGRSNPAQRGKAQAKQGKAQGKQGKAEATEGKARSKQGKARSKQSKRTRERKQAKSVRLLQILNQPCQSCGLTGDDDLALLCDQCDHSYHMACLEPKLTAVPDGDWLCPRCLAAGPKVQVQFCL